MEQKKQVGLRFHAGTLAELDEQVRLRGESRQDVVERYVQEGMRHDKHPLIYFLDASSGRRAAVLGTRLSVSDVVTTIRQADGSAEDAAEVLDLPASHVQAAVRYYAEYRAELDEEIERDALAAEREHELALREREALDG
jgi:uncharacterized protein (DUF433 family)